MVIESFAKFLVIIRQIFGRWFAKNFGRWFAKFFGHHSPNFWSLVRQIFSGLL